MPEYYLGIAHSRDENGDLYGTEVLLFRANNEPQANFIGMALVLIGGDEFNSKFFDDLIVTQVPVEHWKILQRYFHSYTDNQVKVVLKQAAKLIEWVDEAIPELADYEFLNMLRKFEVTE